MLKNFKEAQKAVGHYTGGERPKGDFYATPPSAVEALLSVEKFGHTVLEPCCGNGAISKVLEAHQYNVISRDLHDWGYGETGKDFLTEPIIDVDAVITNPPFKYSVEFAERAMESVHNRYGKVAMLNRVQWLEGQKRRKMFERTRLSKVWVFSKRIPRMHRFDFDGKPGTSLLCFAWFVFDWRYGGDTKLGWL